jgi:hypothetical protein
MLDNFKLTEGETEKWKERSGERRGKRQYRWYGTSISIDVTYH